MRKIIFIFQIFFFCSQFALAEDIKNTSINVKLIDKDLDIEKIPVIKLQISTYPFGGIEFFKSKELSYEQLASPDGNNFNISSPSDIFYMHVSYSGQRIPGGGIYYWVDNIYTIEAGSKLTIELDKSNIKFSGVGSAVPNIQSQIIKHGYEGEDLDRKLFNAKRYMDYFQKLDKSLDSALKLQLKVIEINKDILGDYYVNLLTANCYGYRYFNQLRGYSLELIQNDTFLKTLKEYYNSKNNLPKYPEFTNEVLENAPMLANYLIEEFNLFERIEHEDYGRMLPESYTMNILYKINNSFKGAMKDKLLTIFALRTEKIQSAFLFFEQILDTVKTKRYDELLVSKLKNKRIAGPFKNFELQNENGKIFTLSHFKDKVVVLDFWFTGCENCAILNESMKPIFKHFADNSKILFVNVSIDKNKSQWLKSLKMGTYTHSGNINLYTNGEGSDHDLIKHYNITSYPTVFIIKNGLMFSSLPPRPSRTIQSGQEFSSEGIKLVDLLEKAIKQ